MSYFTQAYAAKLFFKLEPDEYKFVNNTWYQQRIDDIKYNEINKTDGMALKIYDTLVKEIRRIYSENAQDARYTKEISKLGSVAFIKGVITFLKDLASSDLNSISYSS